MRKRNTFIGMILVIAVLVLGVGYAALNGITLTLNGTVNVKANADFRVIFVELISRSTEGKIVGIGDEQVDIVNGVIADGGLSANMTVNLDATNKHAYAIYKIQNVSAELNATVDIKTDAVYSGSASEYLTVDSKLFSDESCQTELSTTVLDKETGVAYLKVMVDLNKLPVEDIQNAIFTIELDATPVSTEVGN